MSNNDAMNSEIRFLEEVEEKLKTRITEINALFLEGEKQIESMHDYYWENYTEMDQYGYEDYDNQQALLNQLNTNQQQMHLKHRFQKMVVLSLSAAWRAERNGNGGNPGDSNGVKIVLCASLVSPRGRICRARPIQK